MKDGYKAKVVLKSGVTFAKVDQKRIRKEMLCGLTSTP